FRSAATTARPVDLSGLAGVHATPGAEGLQETGGGHRIRIDVDAERIDEVVGRLHAGGLRSLVAHPATLEQLFMRHYGEDIAALEPDGGTAATTAGDEHAARATRRSGR